MNQLVTKYIEAHTWTGYFYVDDGLGKHDFIVNFLEALKSLKEDSYFFSESTCDSLPIIDTNYFNINNVSTETYNFRYSIMFKGTESERLFILINRLKKVCKKNFKFVLRNFDQLECLSFKEKSEKRVYRLVIDGDNKKDSLTNFKVIEGNWLPSFSEKRITALWDDNI